MQRGLDYVGSRISISSADAKSREELLAENAALVEENEQLRTQLTNTQLQQAQLDDLLKLYEISATYGEYPTTGAHVIAKGASNWYDTFTIDKGSFDGIKVNMNVIASGGLVGIVTETGENFSIVRSLIDDSNSISAMIVETGDNCIVSGNLEMMNESNMIELSGLEDPDDEVEAGNAVVTSNISSNYVPGLLIGYVDSLSGDKNDLTKSGQITPVVDFKHLNTVLVITKVKETGE
ncbi:MAG: rod shape-determining protein MreC [Lachnospiraceae bacterium]|nr:rod shape-determining protein MreC [Lachnospiraceae bacterium]